MENPLNEIIRSIPPDKLEDMRAEMSNFEQGSRTHVEAANQFRTGLDKVIDVLLILVLKFGRATSVLLAVGILMTLGTVILVVNTIQAVQLRSDVAALLDQQEQFARSQKRLEKTAAENQARTQRSVEATRDQIKSVETQIEKTPRIEVDQHTGRARLVVPKSSQAKSGAKQLKIDLD